MDIRVLGSLAAFADGADVTPTSPNQRTVLAVLAAHPDQHVRADTLVDALWGADPPPTAERTLRSYISRLRSALGNCIVAGRGGFCLATDDIRLDSIEFERRVAEAKSLAPPAAADALRSALDLWHGHAFGELADLDNVCAQARAAEQLRIGTREQLADALLKSGEFAAAVAEADALLAELPLDERAWELLIRALSGGGRKAEALDAYRRAYDSLSEVGLEPSERLQQAQRDAFDAPASAPPQQPPAHNLIGRDDDLAALADIIDRSPLVTTVGPGGVGKTTLAREVARRRAPKHSGGMRVIELAAVTDPSAVADVIVTALGLTSDGGAPLTALQRAGSMDLVVLLDNCEHVLDAVCDVLHAMLPAEPSALRVIATSRELLGMPREHVWPLAPLDCSESDSPAQRFFARQAEAARPGMVTAADAAAITAIVRKLDGLPLAIELAAAQVAALGVEDLAEQIDASLETQVDGLARRGGEPRHRTLRAAIEWSERLLPDEARDALAQWTVFAGAVRRSDALAVLQVAPDVIDELARRSLLTVEIRSGRTYYGMLQTVRSAVGSASEATERRHLQHFTFAAGEAAAALQTPKEAEAHRRIVELIDELRLAHTRARSIDVETAVQMSMVLHWFAVSRLHTDVLGWAAKLQPLVQDQPDLRAAVDSSIAYLHVIAEQLDSAHSLARSALDDAADDQTRCRALEALADCALFGGDLEAARDWASQLVTVAVRAHEAYYEGVGRYVVAISLGYGGQREEADRQLAELDGRYARAAVSPTLQSWMAYLHGETLLDDDPATASAAFSRAIELADAAGSTYVGSVARVSAITLRSRTEAAPDVLPLYADVIERFLDAGSWSYLLTTMRNLVPTLTELGEYVTAVECFGAVTRPEQTPTYGIERKRLSAAEETLRANLSAGDFAHRRAVGGARDLATSGRAAVTAIRGLLSDISVA